MLSWVARSLTLTLRVFSNAFSILSFTSNLLVEVVGLFVVHLRLIFCPLWTNSSICALQFHLAHCDRLISQVHYEQHLESNIRDHPTLSSSKKRLKNRLKKIEADRILYGHRLAVSTIFLQFFMDKTLNAFFSKPLFIAAMPFFGGAKKMLRFLSIKIM